MAKRDVVVLNEQASRLEVPQTGDTYNMPRGLDVQGNANVTGNVSANAVSVGGVNANAGEVAAQALRLPGGTVTAPSNISGQTLAASIANGAEADLAVAGQPRFALTNGNRTLFAVDQNKGLAGMLGNICDPLVWLPLRRAEEITGTQAAAGARYSGAATFTRASTATYIDPLDGLLKTASVDTPRFERMADGGVGLLIEGSSTNLLLQSEAFDAADWTKSAATVTANTVVAPDGNATADKLVEGTAAGIHYAAQTVSSLTAGATYTMSVYAQAAERTWLKIIAFDNVTWFDAEFDLANGLVRATNNTTARITPLANGWYRCEMTFTIDAAQTSATVYVELEQASNVANYTGDGTSGIYLWGAQLEQLPFASSYIPTTTAAVTRATDVLFITAAGNMLSDFTVILDAELPSGVDSVPAYVRLFGQANGGGKYLRTYGSGEQIVLTSTTDITYNMAPSSYIGLHRHVFMHRAGRYEMWHDGQRSYAINSSSVFDATWMSALYIGGGLGTMYGHIRDFRLYDRALTDAEMAAA